jgi:hypothetical protein
LSREFLFSFGRVHAHGGTVRKLNIMSDKTVKELEDIIKALKLKSNGAKIAPL